MLEQASIRIKVIMQPRERRRYDGTLIYNRVGVDEKSRIAYLSLNQSFLAQFALESFVATVNCRLSPCGRNISISLQQASNFMLTSRFD